MGNLNLSQREKIASVITFIVMLLIAIVPQRSFLPKGAFFFDFYWSQVLVLMALAVCLFLLLPEMKLRFSLKKYLRLTWPMLLYSVIELCVLFYGFLHRGDARVLKAFPLSWWFNYGVLLLLLPSVFLLGFIIEWNAQKQASFLVIAFIITTFIVVGEYLYGSGITNPIGMFVHFLNSNTDRIWQWNSNYETLRVTALQSFPAMLAALSLSGMVWVFSIKANHAVKAFLFIDASIILLLTGARTEFIAAAFIILSASIIKINNRGFANWAKKSLPIVFVVVLVFAVFGAVYVEKFQNNFSAGIITRIDSYSQGISDESAISNDEVTMDKLDSLSSGRVPMWVKAAKLIIKNPLGTGMPSGCFLKHSHAHNDFLSKYITEGPLGIILIILMFGWMTNFPSSKYQEEMGLLFAVMTFLVSLTDSAFLQVPVLVIPFFLLGLNSHTVKD